MRLLQTAIAALALVTTGSAHSANNYCGDPMTGSYGPFDYRLGQSTYNFELRMVEHAHYTTEVAAGIKGVSGYLGGDLDYTLRAFPNHAPALRSMAEVALRLKVTTVYGANWPAECYFDRAVRFAPNDSAPYALWANYLYSTGKPDEAAKRLEQALAIDPENPAINYNLGLAHLRTNQYDKALVFAHKAYSQGFPLPGLKKKLVEAGKWVEPPAVLAKPEEKVEPAPPPPAKAD